MIPVMSDDAQQRAMAEIERRSRVMVASWATSQRQTDGLIASGYSPVPDDESTVEGPEAEEVPSEPADSERS